MQHLLDREHRTASAATAFVERLLDALRGQDFSRLDVLAVEAANAAQPASDDSLSAAAAECRGQADYHLGRHASALRAFAKAIGRWHLLGNRTAEVRSRLGHSGLLSACELTTEALEEAHAALALLDESSDFGVYLGALLAIGRVRTTLGAWDEANQVSTRALAAARARGDEGEVGRVLVDLGFFYGQRCHEARSMGDAARLRNLAAHAEACNREPLALCHTTGQAKLEWVASINLGEALMDLGRLPAARQTIEAVLASVRQSTAPSAYAEAEALSSLGRIAFAEQAYERADARLAESIAIAKRHGLNEITMKCHEVLTTTHEALGDHRTALAHHRKFFSAHEQIVSEGARLRSSILGAELETTEARAAVVSERQRSHALERDNLALQRESLEDALTGLPNRRAFQRAFDRFVVDHAGPEADFFLAVIDADDFKRINDAFSHSTGDDVLKALADILRHECRHRDLAARHGGEEFTLMLPDCSPAQAQAACERIRRAIEVHPWKAFATDLFVTVSIGMAGSGECADPAQMFAVADRRLYRAKDAGKNRVVVTDD